MFVDGVVAIEIPPAREEQHKKREVVLGHVTTT
jgi:hypothetical protein